ncbi:hypothetical protein AEM38_11525 [Hyphomonadaceae bacterium UKL13-1]|nr:hypothetical protein AEM38_11525 [Hyphomonadaceae bacterium UKL13-1]
MEITWHVAEVILTRRSIMPLELSRPPQADNDEKSVEMARVWIAQHGVHCTLKIGMYAGNRNVDERRAWGIILADLARHVSNGLCKEFTSETKEANLAAVVDAFYNELGFPTSSMEGEFISKDLS